MREIIHIHVGQAGNKIGSKFFEVLCQEHNLSPDGMVDPRSGSPGETNGGPARWPTEHLDVFFSEASGHRYVPRAVLVDLEPTTLNTVKGSPMGRLFRPDSMVLGARGASNNWAKGFYGEGRDHLDEVMDLLRKEVEDCDCPQGFQICHSIGGGTGAGMGSLLLGELKEAYPDRLLVTYPVFPSPKISEVVVEPYNAMLAINQLLEQSSAVMVLDNEALYDICYNTLKTPNPQFADLNALISAGMAGITASLRFPGLQNMDLRKMTLNLVPFPRMHFFQVSLAPLLSAAVSAYRKRNGWELTEQLFRSNNTMAACDPRDGRYMSACAIFRGHISALEVAESLMRVQANNSAYFVDWVPPSSHMQYCMCHIPPKNPRSPVAAALIGNNTAIRGVFKRVADQHYTMWFRKAFIHWYTDEGMEESEMEEAFNNVNDLMHEYEEHEVFVPGLEEEEELDMKALSGTSALPLPSAELEAANHVASSARDARAPARGKAGKKGRAGGGKKKRTKARPAQA